MNTPDISFERGLPASVDAEKSILGGILLENACFYDCGDIRPEAFALDSHQRIFKRMGEMMNGNHAVDLVTLTHELGNRKEIEAVGGVAYLASLTEGLPRRLSIGEYVGIVRDKWLLRQTIGICSSAITRAADQSDPAEDVIAATDHALLNIAGDTQQEMNIAEQCDEAWTELVQVREGKAERGVSSGLNSLDQFIHGFKKRRLYMVGGRPSMGKSSLMVQAAIQFCRRQIRSRLCSMEMGRTELLHRIWAAVAEIPHYKVTAPESLSADEWKQLDYARKIVSSWPLEIDDQPGQSVDQIIARARISCRRRNTGFLGIDYLQLVRFLGKSELRYQEVSDACARFRNLAKDENIPVMVLSSLTENKDKDTNRRPTLADFRQSGDVGYHADVAILIHRERKDDGTINPVSELIVAKQRGGRVGTANSFYNTDELLFQDGGSNGR